MVIVPAYSIGLLTTIYDGGDDDDNDDDGDDHYDDHYDDNDDDDDDSRNTIILVIHGNTM
jgi:hypothetical protein